MLNSIYKYALENRQRLLESLNNNSDDIVLKAKQRWNTFEPSQTHTPTTLGIDGSYNSSHYQGVDLWVATSVSARPDGEAEIVIPPQIGFDRDSQPQDIMRELEFQACAASVDVSELVLMDGSLRSGLIAGDTESRNRLVSLVEKNKNRIIFVSKTSDVNFEFDTMSATAGDIYYYNKASSQSGFSDIFVKNAPYDGPPISSTYIRLEHSAPLIKIEMLGKVDGSDIKDLIAKLCKQSIGGYPNALRQAHNLCTITNEDVKKIAMIMGIHDMVGSREILR